MRRKLFLIFALAYCSSAFAQTLSPEVKQFVKVDAPVVALEHVRVIDGTGAAAKEDQTVILTNGKIQSVGVAAGAAQVLDLHGYTVIEESGVPKEAPALPRSQHPQCLDLLLDR